MKYKGLVCILAFQALVVFLYFSKFPIFPQFPSVDFKSHVRIATDYARNLPILPPLSQLLLYGGIELYLAVFIRLFPSIELLIVTRWAMAFLVMLSPLVVYSTAKTLFGKEKMALLSTAIWSSGFVWFGMVFNTGLYANFLGVLSSLFLVTIAIRFVKGNLSLLNITLLSSALILVFTSHYSVLFVFLALILMCVYQLAYDYVHYNNNKLKLNWAILLCFLLLPLVVGYFVFPSAVTTLLGFRNVDGPTIIELTPLSDVFRIHLPMLASMVSLIDPPSPMRTDIPSAIIIIFLLPASFYFMIRKQRSREAITTRSILLSWFLFVILVGSGSVSLMWRFAFVGLVPLVFMAGHAFDSLFDLTSFRFNPRHIFRSSFPSMKHFMCFLALVLMLFSVLGNSWSMASLSSSLNSDSTAYASSDAAVYQAIKWMRSTNLACGFYHNESCSFATPTDWRFSYSELMGGPVVNLLTPVFATPDLVLHDAAGKYADYLIVTYLQNMRAVEPTATNNPFQCTNPAGEIIAISVLNSSVRDSFKLSVVMDPPTNGSVSFYLDAARYGSIALKNGRSIATITEFPPGEHDIRVGYQFTRSNVVTVFGHSDFKPIDRGQHGYCEPYWFYEDDLGRGAKIVYEIPGELKIWCISLRCR